ncbi:MAG: EAL domain-containing protein [Fibrobacteria bacterium]|nr:EAL domain-containing protein [Fibrobacteria bacterium]
METKLVKALLVDPNRRTRRLLSDLIDKTTFTITQHYAATTKATLHKASENFFDIYLVSDLMFPDRVTELIKKISDQESDSAIIYCCQTNDEALGLEAIRAGASDYVLYEYLTWRQLEHTIRAAMERALRERSFRQDYLNFNMLSNSTLESVVITENAKIFEANKSFQNLFGVTSSQMVGFPISKFFSKETGTLISDPLFYKHGEFYEGMGLKKNGTRFPLEIRGEVLFSKGRQFNVFAVRDITNNKISRNALKQNQERFSFIRNEIHDCIWEWDLKRNTLNCSPTISRFLPIKDDLPVSWKDFGQYLIKSDRAFLLNTIWEQIHDTKPFELKLRLQRPVTKDVTTLRLKGKPIFGNSGMPTTMIGIISGFNESINIVNPENDLQIGQLSVTSEFEEELKSGIENNEFLLHYQPIISIKTGRITGFESLIRWNHPKKGLLHPGSFLAQAEKSGQIVKMGEWVLEKACRQNQQWEQMFGYPLRVAVNLSTNQMQDDQITNVIERVLSETSMDPKNLEIEVSESSMFSHDKQSNTQNEQILKGLSKLGINIAIDDFGTGLSSLQNLENFPNHTIKIDNSIIQAIFQKPNREKIVDSMINLAKALDFNLVAEGVETRGQFDFLKGTQCDEAQGFHFSRPLASEQFAVLIKSDKHFN